MIAVPFFGITSTDFPRENVFAKGSDSERDSVLQRMPVGLLPLYVTLEQLKSGIYITNAWESEA